MTGIRILLHMKKWKEAETLSKKGMEIYPDEGELVVQHAFSLLHQGQSKKSLEVLRQAPEWIFKTGILYYNLACYEARLGNEEVARQFIEEAKNLNTSLQKLARTDEDLKKFFFA